MNKRIVGRINEAVLRRLLMEAAGINPDGLAAFIHTKTKGISVTLYDMSKTQRIVDSGKMRSPQDMQKGVVGFISVRRPSGEWECAGAWEVDLIAGPGRGKEMYGLGYAVSPSGRLMSSRSAVSQQAGSAWEKAFKKGRGVLKLDDKDDPKTDDPSDDCKVHSVDDYDCDEERDQLNWVYGPEGWEQGFLSALQANHDSFVKDSGQEAEALETCIHRAGATFFDWTYGGYED